MNVSKKLLLLSLLACLPIEKKLISHPIDPIDEPELLTNQSDLHSALYSQEPTIIMLKSNNCPHCKTMQQDLKPYITQHPKINFYMAVNSQQLQLIPFIKTVDASLKIPGFPTLIFVYKGKIIDHQIGANSAKIKEKITKLISATKAK